MQLSMVTAQWWHFISQCIHFFLTGNRIQIGICIHFVWINKVAQTAIQSKEYVWYVIFCYMNVVITYIYIWHVGQWRAPCCLSVSGERGGGRVVVDQMGWGRGGDTVTRRPNIVIYIWRLYLHSDIIIIIIIIIFIIIIVFIIISNFINI